MSRRTIGLPRCQIFESERHARAWVESRAWKDGPVCPHCGNGGQKRITQLGGRSHRAGLYQCNRPSCRRQFTITVGTVLEDSKIPLHKWLAALFLISASGARVPVTHVHRALEISYKSSWFMVRRLRQALPQAEPWATTIEPMLSQTQSIEEEQVAESPPPTPMERRPLSEPSLKEQVQRLNAFIARIERGRSGQRQPRNSSEAYPHGEHRWRKMLGD